MWISSDLGDHLDQLVAPEFVAASTLEVCVIGCQRSVLNSDLAYQCYPGAEPSLEDLEPRDKPSRAPERGLTSESQNTRMRDREGGESSLPMIGRRDLFSLR